MAGGAKVKYLSLFSGIEAASVAWKPLGWEAVAFAETENFPSRVLAHHYPDVPNWGDVTKYEEWPDANVDVLVGGSPCQSFSVAGLRKGLDDPRGNLMLTYLAIANKYKPKYLAWENVPGVLSAPGEPVQIMLDSLTQMGYVVDVDIHDAQYFGLAQRRRRIYILCVKLSDLLHKRTPISARITSELLVQALLDTWSAIPQVSSPGKYLSASERPTGLPIDLLRKRMGLLGNLLGGEAVTALLRNWEDHLHPSTGGQKLSELIIPQQKENGQEGSRMGIGGLPQSETGGECGDKNIGLLWSELLGEILSLRSKSITSIMTSKITESKICFFAKRITSIIGYTLDSPDCLVRQKQFGDLWSLASLSLTLLREITNYARQASSDLFGEPALRHHWRTIVVQAEACATKFKRDIGDEGSTEEIFSLSESLRGDPPPRRKAGERVAPTVSGGAPFSRTGNERVEAEAMVVMATAQGGAEITSGYAPTLNCNHEQPIVAIAGNTIGRKPENGGNGDGFDESGASYTPTKTDIHAVAYGVNGASHRLRAGASRADKPESTTYIQQSMKVRRLTPLECERLQGFPDFYTNIPGASDSARYKALGNSMAVNVMRAIGDRIKMVEEIK